MRKILLGALIITSSVLFAGETEDFYYDRGYEVGYQKGLLKGQEVALKEAKKIVKEFKERVRAYEIGKYLVESKRLTAPQVFQELDEEGNMKIVVIPSRIERELSIDDIFAKFGSIPKKAKKMNTLETVERDFNETNSVYLSDRDDTYSSIPDSSNRDSKIRKLRVSKSSKNRDILNSSNVAYIENEYNYEVAFFTQQEKREFCQQFKTLCRK